MTTRQSSKLSKRNSTTAVSIQTLSTETDTLDSELPISWLHANCQSRNESTILIDVLGVITARGGSKSIPNKNLVPLGGRPLLAYTCEAALASGKLSRLIVSTDDEQIARAAREFGVEVPFLRPAELSRDETPSLPVIQHAVRWIEKEEQTRIGAAMMDSTEPTYRRWCSEL